MKYIVALVTAVCLLFGCATAPHGTMAISPEVRKMSTADETLFRDLLTQRGGVAFADMIFYPHSQRKTLTRIEVLTPYDNHRVGQERWFVEHEDGTTTAYRVRFIPDGRGGTTFTVQRDSSATNKDSK